MSDFTRYALEAPVLSQNNEEKAPEKIKDGGMKW
jgi:hypothetical protein